ncbi:MAG TPA: LysR substrate-binding domain-containing protein [Thermoanaerobaculia bacterium]|jgi:DNA-binding transcriptional LysR family regulator|nr:LysR substrate-binding domain-containing protein [Thermoanaerobaculia bacterium]
MDWQELRVFEAVARTGGITRAAVELFTVQSNVTARVRQLERDLGVALFDRHSRGVSLTQAGRDLLPYAARMRTLLEEARRAVGGAAAVPRGPLRIGAMETTTAVRLPALLASFAAAHPQVDLSLRTGTTRELVAEVLGRRLDGAFVAGPVHQAGLIEVPAFREELVIVAPAGCADWLAMASAEPAGVKLLVFRAGCVYRRRLERLLETHGIGALRLLELGTLDGILGCVGAGVGITLLPRVVAEPAAAAGVVSLHALPAAQARVDTVLVRRADAPSSAALARFVEHATGDAPSARPAGRGVKVRTPGPPRPRPKGSRGD